jgi:hypothetical protein
MGNHIQREEATSIIFESKIEAFDSRYSINGREIEVQNDKEISIFK